MYIWIKYLELMISYHFKTIAKSSYSYVLLVLCISFSSYSQSHLDSLKEFDIIVSQINQAKNPTQKLNQLFYAHYYQLALLGELNEKNCFTFNTTFAKQAIDLAIEQEKYDTLKSLTIDVGYIYDLRKQYDTSFNYYYQCFEIFEATGKYELTYSVAQNILYNNSAMQKEIDESNKMKLEQKRKIEKLTYIGIAVLLLFITFLIYFFVKTHRKNKTLAFQKLQIEKSKHALEISKQAIEESKKEIDNSIDYAQNIQQAILSDETKFKKLFSQSFVLFMPRDKVSGDFLWTYKKEHLTYIAVADCTGHGVPGALLSIVGHFLFDTILVSDSYKSPAVILNELHISLIKALNQEDTHNEHNNDGMDVGIIEINSQTNKVTFSGANRTLLHIKKDILNQYKGVKRPIGGTQFEYKSNFINETFDFEKDDLIYSFSDGYQDQIGGEKNKKIMSKNLIALIEKNAHEPIDKQKEILKTHFINYKGNNEQIDDVLVIGIKF